MNKKGFTLAEVLITLGIVGVVAALTAPGLILQSRNEANASKLSVLMANVENALTTAIASEQVADLTETRMWNNRGNAAGFTGELGRYLHITGQANNIPQYTTLSGGNPNADMTAMITQIAVSTKNDAIIYIDTNPQNSEDDDATIIAAGGSLTNCVGTVAIDVNGSSEPNRWGRDLFAFMIGEDGILYPYGGNDVNIYNGSTADCNASRTGLGCAAQVIRNGFRIDY